MVSGQTDATSALKTHAHELVKQYISYDGSNRVEYVFTAYFNADHGDPCERTQYVYDGGTSRVIKRKETLLHLLPQRSHFGKGDISYSWGFSLAFFTGSSKQLSTL